MLQACSLIFWNDSLHYGNVLEEIGIEGYEKMSTSAPFLVVMIFFRYDIYQNNFWSVSHFVKYLVRWSSLSELFLSAIQRCASGWMGADDQSETDLKRGVASLKWSDSFWPWPFNFHFIFLKLKLGMWNSIIWYYLL